jgi:signal transduction histidine kinase
MNVGALSREELQSLQAQVRQLQAELAAERAACEEARRQVNSKDEFLAVVAHELRAPLGAILGWAHMLRRGLGEEETERGLDVIEQSVQVQAKLIDDLIVASRMASNKIRLDIGPVDLRAVVESAAESVRPMAADKDLALAIRMDAANGHVGPLSGDPTRLQQVLCNVLTNAVKFTPCGGKIDIALASSRGWAIVSVKDTGAGIAPGFLPHVFERFRQGPSAARAHGGLGLGLAIARHLVELHDGEITAESEGEGCGATFTVRLPLPDALRP